MKPTEEKNGGKKRTPGYFLLQSMTLGRIPIAVLFLVVLIYGKETTFTLVLALFLLLIIEFTDLYDGIIARRFGLVSEAGATLDPFADSVFVTSPWPIPGSFWQEITGQSLQKKAESSKPLSKPSVPF
jgi:hypothetical protein